MLAFAVRLKDSWLTEPEEDSLHHETQSRHCDPISHPINDESDSTVFSTEIHQESHTDKGKM